MKISIQLITYNAEKYLTQCFASIFSQSFKDFELVIIDNASTDHTQEMIQKWIKEHPEVISCFIESEKNLGFTGGHNLALKYSKGEYILFLNQDIILEPNFLENAIAFLGNHPEAGSISPKLLRLARGEKTSTIDSLGITFQKNLQAIDFCAGKEEKDLSQTEKYFEIFAPSGACPMHRRMALENILSLRGAELFLSLRGAKRRSNHEKKEYLDDDFFMYKDDVDLGFRLAFQGWKSYCVLNAVAYHERSAKETTRGKFFWQIARNRAQKSKLINSLSYQNHWFVIVKNIPVEILWKHFFPFIWYEIKKNIYLFLFEWSTIKNLPKLFGKIPDMKKKRKLIFRDKKIDWKELERRMFLHIKP